MRLGILAAAAVAALSANAATFHKDVAPILQKNCQECHRPGEIGPMPLRTYKEARPWAKSIKQVVAQGKMPPWFADPAHGKFANDRRLSQAEIDTLVAWVDGGAKEGNPKDAPAPREFASGWKAGTPDHVVQMAKPFPIPAEGKIDYSWIVVPTGFTEDKWIDTLEVRPGDRSVVHHVVIYAREPGSYFMKDAKPGEPYYPPGRMGTPQGDPPDNGRGLFEFQVNPKGVEIVGLYVPGGDPYSTRPGQARFIKAGSDLILQMHYTASGKATQDQTKIGFRFAKQPPKERAFNTFIANPSLKIPAGAPNHPIYATVTLQADVTVQSLSPHMHLRGKAFQYRVIYPDGKDEILLKVPNYDFNWQITYQLAEPRRLPAGTKIECIAWFDNSPNNKYNPDPKQVVRWGDQSWEEMLAGFIDFGVPVDFNYFDLTRRRQ